METLAIKFLQKTKVICESRYGQCITDGCREQCPVFSLCNYCITNINEADLIRKVMEHRLEDVDAERN